MPLKKAKLMIVDDDRSFLNELSDMLEMNGYQTAKYDSVIDALHVVKDIRPDVILTDLKMKGLNGFQFVTALKRMPETSSIPVIPMTGFYTEKEHNFLIHVSGLPVPLIKPFQPEDVFKKIKECLDQGSRDPDSH